MATLAFYLMSSLALLASTDVAGRARLCVDARTSQLRVQPLLTAIRARLARPHLHVSTCDDVARSQAEWVVEVVRGAPQGVHVSLAGVGLHDVPAIELAGLSDGELSQQVAITVAEAVGPSVDALLAKMGLAANPRVQLDGPVSRLAADPGACVSGAPLEPSWVFAAELGASVGVQRGAARPAMVVEAARWQDVWALVVGARASYIHDVRDDAVGVLGGAAAVAVGGARRWSNIAVAVAMVNRLSYVAVRDNRTGERLQARRTWLGGASLGATVGMGRVAGHDVAATARVDVWPVAQRFAALGQRQVQLDALELSLGVQMTLGESTPPNFYSSRFVDNEGSGND